MKQLPYYSRFSHLGQPLGPYLALMGMTGRMDPRIGAELGDLLQKVDLKAISSPIFGPMREAIVLALKSNEHPETQLRGVRLFQLALQFEGETSAVLPVIQKHLAERDQGLLLRMITREAEAAKAVFHELDPVTGFPDWKPVPGTDG